MSGYSYEIFIKDFTKRTLSNYEKIKNTFEKNETQRYEVTQLINSLFGLLIIPNEKYKYRKNQTGVRENTLKKTKSYESILNLILNLKAEKRYYSSYNDKNAVSDFIRHMRNSLAHSGNQGLHFLPLQEGSEINAVIFYDCYDKETGEKNEFCTELTISEIDLLAKDIAEMYSKIESYENVKEKREAYEDEIVQRRKLFKRGK